MNKKKLSVSQFILGFGIVMFLWAIGLLAGDPYGLFFDIYTDSNIDVYLILDIVLAAIPILICLYLILLSFICKLKSYKVMYYSALLAFCLPLVGYMFNELSLSDSSIITWILNLTVGLVLIPFGIVGLAVFDSIDLGGYCEGIYIVALMALVAVISMVIYKTIKRNN